VAACVVLRYQRVQMPVRVTAVQIYAKTRHLL
jgi:hypothetical protein